MYFRVEQSFFVRALCIAVCFAIYTKNLASPCMEHPPLPYREWLNGPGPHRANDISQNGGISQCAIKLTSKCNENCVKHTVEIHMLIGYTTSSGEQLASSCSSRC